MATDEEFRALTERVDRLERVVSGVDADVAAVQAQRRADLELLMALRGTQLQQDERLSGLEGNLVRLEAGLTEHRTEMRAGFEVLTGLIGRLLPEEE
jgi:hypothetical protein